MRAESLTLDANLVWTWVPKQSATWLAPIASIGPVDPTPESLLWPGCVGFCFVAGLAAALPLSLSAGTKRKSDRRRHEARRDLVVRERELTFDQVRQLLVAQAAMPLGLCVARSRT